MQATLTVRSEDAPAALRLVRAADLRAGVVFSSGLLAIIPIGSIDNARGIALAASVHAAGVHGAKIRTARIAG